jgi:RNA polymerase-binding transcription factor DksA
MTSEKTRHYRDVLEQLARRVRATSATLEEATRTPAGGEAGGSLSNTPLHLGDVGTEVYTQELNATLLENEEFIRREVLDALDRHNRGVFGVCEECRKPIPKERLDALPYARYCVPCAEKLQAGADVNLNDGRPTGWGSTLEHPAELDARKREGEQSPFTAARGNPGTAADEDPHAIGTPGGGTGLGGLAGTNLGEGNPDDGPLEEAMGSGSFDLEDEADEPPPDDAYSGRAGGAVGGTPANKRSAGGHRSHGERG